MEQPFKTCDLYLAAFYVASGYKMISHDRDGSRIYFAFENDDNLSKLRNDYFARSAMVAASVYADAIKSLKNLCHD
jgi:hypothetical protein